MKLGNFASFDPVHKKRNVKGLGNASSLDRAIWEEFEATPNKVAAESEEAFSSLPLPSLVPAELEPHLPFQFLKPLDDQVKRAIQQEQQTVNLHPFPAAKVRISHISPLSQVMLANQHKIDATPEM